MDNVVQGLLFDLDNTLVDREAAFLRVAVEFYGQFHSAMSSLTRDEAVAMMVRWDCDGYANREAMFAKWLCEWPDTGLSIDALVEWYRTEKERQVEPDIQVNAFLANLNNRQVPWGIVTNGNAVVQRNTCRAAGIDQLAPFIIVSEEAGYAKPDPRIFRDALKATGLAAPQQVVFVGDNPSTDIAGAMGFGMNTAWVRRDRQYPEGLQPPDYVINSVSELRSVVSGIL